MMPVIKSYLYYVLHVCLDYDDYLLIEIFCFSILKTIPLSEMFYFQDANRNVDELLGVGASILQGIRDQGNTLKGAHKRVLNLVNTLGLSNTVMRMIERRSTQDKYILIAGMVIVLLCLYFALRYL